MPVGEVDQRLVDAGQAENEDPRGALDLLLLRRVDVPELLALLVVTPGLAQVVQGGDKGGERLAQVLRLLVEHRRRGLDVRGFDIQHHAVVTAVTHALVSPVVRACGT